MYNFAEDAKWLIRLDLTNVNMRLNCETAAGRGLRSFLFFQFQLVWFLDSFNEKN